MAVLIFLRWETTKAKSLVIDIDIHSKGFFGQLKWNQSWSLSFFLCCIATNYKENFIRTLILNLFAHVQWQDIIHFVSDVNRHFSAYFILNYVTSSDEMRFWTHNVPSKILRISFFILVLRSTFLLNELSNKSWYNENPSQAENLEKNVFTILYYITIIRKCTNKFFSIEFLDTRKFFTKPE